MKQVSIYCDGSAIGNPGPGGWGAVVSDRARVKEAGGRAAHTTNNRMELTAAIESLGMLRTKSRVTVHTDSRYVINGITKWVRGWEAKGWKTLGKTDVQNQELWQALMKVSAKHDVTWEHVKGHSGVSLNERVDVIANGFARNGRAELFSGSLAAYRKFLEGMPKVRAVASSSKKKNTGKAYSYVSLLDGKVMVHKTWAECEQRVKGKPARFKKALTKEEETDLVRRFRNGS